MINNIWQWKLGNSTEWKKGDAPGYIQKASLSIEFEGGIYELER